jgi:hypothetical protein
MRLRARLRKIGTKAGEPEQRRGGSEPEKTGAAHAEFSGAPVDPADQAFRQVDIDPLRRIRRIHADDETGDEVASPGERDALDRRRIVLITHIGVSNRTPL